MQCIIISALDDVHKPKCSSYKYDLRYLSFSYFIKISYVRTCIKKIYFEKLLLYEVFKAKKMDGFDDKQYFIFFPARMILSN